MILIVSSVIPAEAGIHFPAVPNGLPVTYSAHP